MGKELLYVRELILSGKFPLVGLSTSHEWLNYGPIYYWILIPLVKIFGSSTYILFWLTLAVSIIGSVITYFVFSKMVSKRFAIILSFFIAVSPYTIYITRLSKLHTFFFILIPLFIYFLKKIWDKQNKFIIWLGIIFGLFFSFHFSQIPLLLVIFAVFWLRKKDIKIKDYFKFSLGIIIPNLTILINEFSDRFLMIKNLIAWIPYRFAGFVGIYPKNNLDISSAKDTVFAFNDFLGRNLFWDTRFFVLGSLIFIILFVAFVIQNRKKFTTDFFVFYVISSTVVQCLALIIHTVPPIHYFLPIFLNFGLLFSFYTCQFWELRSTKIFTVIIFILMFVAGFLGINNEHALDSDYISLETQKNITAYIVKDAKGKPFALERIGAYDYFPENYAQNYIYLILTKGGKIDQFSKLKYTINDSGKIIVFKNE